MRLLQLYGNLLYIQMTFTSSLHGRRYHFPILLLAIRVDQVAMLKQYQIYLLLESSELGNA